MIVSSLAPIPSIRRIGLVLACGLTLAIVGCGPTEVETQYGRSRGLSINGTNALLAMLSERGHPVRVAIRYNETLGNWANVVIRFAPYPGPPSATEAGWINDWLGANPARKLVYIARDYDAGPEFWSQMLAVLPRTGADAERARIEARRTGSLSWPTNRPDRAKIPASVDQWFGTAPADPVKPAEVTTCRALDGPWAEGIDATAAALPKHEVIRAENDENVLLSGDGAKLVISWTTSDDADDNENKAAEPVQSSRGGVLVLANGAFLLNGGLLNKARRPLADRVVDWIGPGTGNVAFVEGTNLSTDGDPPPTSPFRLLTVEPFNWIGAHLAIFGGLLALALAATLGRPRPERGDSIERPSAHPIALGAILARTRQAAVAQEIMTTYRRWREPSGSTHRTDPARSSPTTPRRVPRA